MLISSPRYKSSRAEAAGRVSNTANPYMVTKQIIWIVCVCFSVVIVFPS